LAHSIISKGFLKHSVGFCSSFLSLKQNLMQILYSLKSAMSVGEKNRRTTNTRRYRNACNTRTRPLSLPDVGTLIRKGYCSAHLAAEGRTTTGSRALFKFPELLGSTSYYSGDLVKEHHMVYICRAHRKNEKCKQNCDLQTWMKEAT
jgi:hypothetical protein